jgi:hypothetical protein
VALYPKPSLLHRFLSISLNHAAKNQRLVSVWDVHLAWVNVYKWNSMLLDQSFSLGYRLARLELACLLCMALLPFLILL